LFLCTGNSARSILAEALLNSAGGTRFVARSAGSHPAGRVHPEALRLLREKGLASDDLYSKSWDDFVGRSAFDLVITVCDAAAGESCPLWPGNPLTVHWGLPDPAAVTGADSASAFLKTYECLNNRVTAMVRLPLESMTRDEQMRALQSIARENKACDESA
jgi:arsenate reductase